MVRPFGLLPLLAAGLLLGACQTGQQIAVNTPPAMAPVIALQDPLDIESGSVGLSVWPGENRFYAAAERRRFTLILRSGQLNRIEFTAAYLPVSSNPMPIVRTDMPTDPSNNARWTYVLDNLVLSQTEKTQVAHYTFYPPVDGTDVLEEGRRVWIRAKEESNNPAFRGRQEQFAESLFEIVPVAANGCTVPIFVVQTGYVDTKVRGCKEYAIDANGTEMRRERTSARSADFPPDPTPTIGTGFVYTGFDTIRLVAVDALRRETFANKYKQAGTKPPCLTSTTVDNGDGKKVKFRTPC
jgi:hypothetical protein